MKIDSYIQLYNWISQLQQFGLDIPENLSTALSQYDGCTFNLGQHSVVGITDTALLAIQSGALTTSPAQPTVTSGSVFSGLPITPQTAQVAATGAAVCDCGGSKVNLPHYSWCAISDERK